jgi:hypothetical protein
LLEIEYGGREILEIPEGVIAHYEQQFEEKKWCLNYRSDEPLIVSPHPAGYILALECLSPHDRACEVKTTWRP